MTSLFFFLFILFGKQWLPPCFGVLSFDEQWLPPCFEAFILDELFTFNMLIHFLRTKLVVLLLLLLLLLLYILLGWRFSSPCELA